MIAQLICLQIIQKFICNYLNRNSQRPYLQFNLLILISYALNSCQTIFCCFLFWRMQVGFDSSSIACNLLKGPCKFKVFILNQTVQIKINFISIKLNQTNRYGTNMLSRLTMTVQSKTDDSDFVSREYQWNSLIT